MDASSTIHSVHDRLAQYNIVASRGRRKLRKTVRCGVPQSSVARVVCGGRLATCRTLARLTISNTIIVVGARRRYLNRPSTQHHVSPVPVDQRAHHSILQAAYTAPRQLPSVCSILQDHGSRLAVLFLSSTRRFCQWALVIAGEGSRLKANTRHDGYTQWHRPRLCIMSSRDPEL